MLATVTSSSPARTAPEPARPAADTRTADPRTARAHDRPAPDHAAHPAPARLDPRDRSVITLLLISAFVVILNETILSVALPRIMHDLTIDASTAQWLTTAFMLTMAVIIPITGFLMQRLTTRQMFSTAMTLFTVGTAICALAPSFVPLLAGRVVQASGTAMMMPLLMTTVMQIVPPSLHGRVMGNISIVISVAPAVGPTVSGLVLSVLPWRFLFVLVLPIAIGALALGVRRIENVGETSHTRVDILSVLLSGIGFGSLVYGLAGLGGGHDAAAAQHTSSTPLIVLAVGAVVLALFVLRQLSLQRRDAALLDLRTFASKNFALSVILMVLMMGAMFGMIVLLPIYAQSVLGLETVHVGLMLLPGGLVMGLAAPVVGRLYDRFGPRPLLVPGLLLVVTGMLVLSRIGTETTPLLIVGGHLLISVGLACVFTPLFTNALGSLPPQLMSHGSAIVGTVQQVAGAAGTAVMVALMVAGSAAAQADGATPAQGIVHGTATVFLIGAGLALGSAVIALFVTRNPGEGGAPGTGSEDALEPEHEPGQGRAATAH